MMKRLIRTSLAVCASLLLLVLGLNLFRAGFSLERLTARLLTEPFRFQTRTAPLGPVVVKQVQQLGRLETCRYTEQVVVKGDTKNVLPTWLAGDRMLFVGRGEVVAGVDLSQLRPEDVQTTNDQVSIRLPASEIFHTRLDNNASEVFERKSGIFSGPDRNLETKVRLEAEMRMQQASLEDGILRTADTNAREALRRQMTLLGFREVRFL